MFGSVLSVDAQAALAVLVKSGLVQDAYLAGGSALALLFGHRYSVDFDFFTQKAFDPNQMSKTLSQIGTFQEEFAKGISLIGVFNGIKMSCFQYSYPLLEKTIDFLGVPIANYQDIAAMKIVAIGDRSTRKDFIDIHEIVHQGNTIDEILSWYDQKYHKLEANIFTIVRSLTYFDEAEDESMPDMIRPVLWEDVKKFFIAESRRLAKKYLEN